MVSMILRLNLQEADMVEAPFIVTCAIDRTKMRQLMMKS